MKKSKLLVLGLIYALMAIGLVLAGCMTETECKGNGECTVSVTQGSYGLSIDSNQPRSTCGDKGTYSSDTGKYSGGCNVQNAIDNPSKGYGKYTCDC